MKGSVTKYRQTNGRVSWGYHFRPSKDPAGKWIRVTKQGFETKREAESELADALREYAISATVPKSKETFGSFFEYWMKEYALRHTAPKTAERYGELGAYAVRELGTVTLQELRPLILEKAFNRLLDHGGQKSPKFPEGRPLSARTVRHIAFTVYGALKKAVAWDKLSYNPADFTKITLPKAEKKDVTVVEKENLGRILNVSVRRSRLYPLLLLAAGTGARRGELLALCWDDINFETGLMKVAKSLEETKAGLRVKSTKSGRPRSFIVPRQSLDALIAHRTQQDRDKRLYGTDYTDHGLIFCRPEGGYYKPDKVSVRVTELIKKTGLLDVGLHTLRHTHASQLLSKNVPIAVVSERLGHKHAGITLGIYTHMMKADEMTASQVWEDEMQDVIEKQGTPPDTENGVSGNVMTEPKNKS